MNECCSRNQAKLVYRHKVKCKAPLEDFFYTQDYQFTNSNRLYR